MNAALYALLLAGAAFAGTHELAGPGWSAQLTPASRTLRFGGASVRMELAGGNAAASLSELPGRLRYSEVYDGIHLDFYRAANELEYDFVVAPGADPTKIGMVFPGVGAVVIDDHGELVTGSLRHRAPVSYQIRDGRLQRVASRFVLRGETVGFEVGAYDPALPLVIDPVLTQRFLAGGTFEATFSVVKDAAGNSYFGTWSAPGNVSLLRKVGPTGALLASTILPIDNGVNTSFPPAFVADFHLAVDSAQNVYAGSQSKSCPANATRIIGSPATPGTFLLIFKLLPDAATIGYLTCVKLDGANNRIADVTLDTAGNAYIVGTTDASVFPATSTFGPIVAGSKHGFVTKVDPAGQSFNFSIIFGSGTEATSVARDLNGNLLVGGLTGPDFQTVSPRQGVFGGGTTDGFLMKVRADGLQVLNATFHGGSGADAIRDLAVQAAGAVTVGGETASTNFPLQGADSSPCVATDGFVSRLDAALSTLSFSTCVPGTEQSKVTHLALVSTGGVVAAGQVAGSMLQVTKLENSGKLLYNMHHTFLTVAGVFPTATGFAVGGTEGFPASPALWTFEERADLGLKFNSTQVQVRNFGPDPATGVVLTIEVSTNSLQLQDSRCFNSGRRAICKLGTLPVGDLPAIPYSAASPARIEVTSQAVDLDLSNNHN